MMNGIKRNESKKNKGNKRETKGKYRKDRKMIFTKITKRDTLCVCTTEKLPMLLFHVCI
jgi:hypothetical protein